MLLLSMMAGALRPVGEREKDKGLGTGSMRDVFTSQLLAGQGGVLWLERLGDFLMLSFLRRLLVR